MKERKNGYIYYDYRVKTEKEEIAETAWRSVFRWLYAIVGVLVVFFVSWTLFFHIVGVDGSSMQPTLSDNDRLFVYTFNYKPQNGDIVVIASETGDAYLVKRVVALEKQVVDVDSTGGVVYVDGGAVEGEYAFPITKKAENEIAYPYTVPDGKIFVMGDNRDDSVDSRSRFVGAVDESRIIGKVVFRFYPFSDFRFFN